MSRYKRLKSITIYDDDDLKGLKETAVNFNKEGWYLDRLSKTSWYEIKTSIGIRAFESRIEDFNYSLNLARHSPLGHEEVAAVKVILRIRRNKYLENLYYTDFDWKKIRDTRREMRLWLNKTLKDVLKN